MAMYIAIGAIGFLCGVVVVMVAACCAVASDCDRFEEAEELKREIEGQDE